MTNPLSVTFAQVNAATWDGKYEDDEQDAIQVLIDQAARKLLAKRRRLSDWVAAGSVTPAPVPSPAEASSNMRSTCARNAVRVSAKLSSR